MVTVTHPSSDVPDNADETKLFFADRFFLGTSQTLSFSMFQLVGHQGLQGMVSHGGSHLSEV